MPDYTAFAAEEFVFDPGFQEWVRRPTRESDLFWQQWLAGHPDKNRDLQQARQLVLSLHTEQPTASDEQIRLAVEQMLAQLQPASTTIVRPLWASGQSLRWLAAAASVVLIVGLGWWWQQQPATDQLADQLTGPVLGIQNVRQQTNSGQVPLRLSLPDGSHVTLSPRSRISYPAVFSDSSREVMLTGEAFFEVVRNPAKPFAVYTDAVVTRVLGTSFRVVAYDGQPVSVAVRTGKVSVYARQEYSRQVGQRSGGSGLLLLPNQQADFSVADHQFRKTLVEQPVLVDTRMKASDFEFDETPVNEVFRRLEQAYGIDIVYEAEVLTDCALTASLTDENLSDKLRIVCLGIGAKYEIVDGRVVIYAKGC